MKTPAVNRSTTQVMRSRSDFKEIPSLLQLQLNAFSHSVEIAAPFELSTAGVDNCTTRRRKPHRC